MRRPSSLPRLLDDPEVPPWTVVLAAVAWGLALLVALGV